MSDIKKQKDKKQVSKYEKPLEQPPQNDEISSS